MAGSMPSASAACLMLIAPVLIDSKICRVFGSVLARSWPVMEKKFLIRKKITKDLSSSEAGLLHSKRASSTQMSPYKWRNRFLRLERNQIAGLHMHCMATNAENVSLCMWYEETTYIARTGCHKKPLTAQQHPSCRFLYFSPPEIWIQLELGYHPENLE